MTTDVRPEGSDAARDAPPAAVPRRTWIGLAAAFACLLLLFHPILVLRGHFYWTQPRYSHCMLLPFVSAVWVWDRWDTIRAAPRAPSTGWVVATLGAVLAFLYGRVQNVNLVQHAAFLAAVAGTIGSFFGTAVLRRLAFPLGYLVLTIPLPNRWDEAIVPPLQAVATRTAEAAFDLFGWVVVRQGNVLHLPGLRLLVEDACSGIHSLYALVALGVAYAAFFERPAWLRAVLVVSTVPIAVAANSLRVIVTGILAYEVDPKYAEGASHETTGMVVFGTGLVLLVGLDALLRPDPSQRESVSPPTDGTAPPGSHADG